MPRRLLPIVLAAHLVIMLLAVTNSVIACITAVVIFIGLRRLFIARLGGTTGDTAGALVELLECGVLVALALFAA
jgi:adenosylcobinamide-GDP ribazoletransferase